LELGPGTWSSTRSSRGCATEPRTRSWEEELGKEPGALSSSTRIGAGMALEGKLGAGLQNSRTSTGAGAGQLGATGSALGPTEGVPLGPDRISPGRNSDELREHSWEQH
jgi:hypothetical protein